MWRKLGKTILFLLMLATVGCGGKTSIKVGFAGELTGMQSDLGVQGRNGVLIALDEINANGGINGKPLELVVEDDLGTPEGAHQADQKLIDAGVVAIIGHMTSGQTKAGMEVTEPAGMVLVSPTASSVTLSGIVDHLYRMASISSIEAGLLAEVAWRDQVHTVVIFRDKSNDPYTIPYENGFRSNYEQLGGVIIQEVVYSGKEPPDYETLSQVVTEDDPQGVLIISAAMDTALLSQQILLTGWEGHLYTSGWAHSDILIPNGGGAVEGMKLVTRHTCLAPRPQYAAFAQDYQEHYGRPPSNPAEYAYEAMQVLGAALQKTDGKSQGLDAALLETRDFEGLFDTFSLDQYGDAIHSVCELIIRNGEFVPLGEVNGDQ